MSLRDFASLGIVGKVGLTCLLLLSCALSGLAEGKEFTLHNHTGKEIKQIYIGPANSESFGEEIAIKPIAVGATVQIRFRSSAADNHWEMRVAFVDDSSTVWAGLNLSNIKELTISYRDGKPTATSK